MDRGNTKDVKKASNMKKGGRQGSDKKTPLVKSAPRRSGRVSKSERVDAAV